MNQHKTTGFMKNRFVSFVSLLMVWLLYPVVAQGQSEVLEELKPALDAQSISMLSLDLDRLPIKEVLNQLCGPEIRDSLSDWDSQVSRFDKGIQQIRSIGAEELVLIFRLGPLTPENRILAFRCHDEPSAKLVAKQLSQLSPLFGRQLRIKVVGSTVYLGKHESDRSEWIEQIADRPEWKLQRTESELASLKSAWNSSKRAPIRWILSLTPDQRRAIVEFGSQEDPWRTLQTQTQWMSLSFWPSKKQFQVRLSMENAVSVQAVQRELQWLGDRGDWKVEGKQLTWNATNSKFDTVVSDFANSVLLKSAMLPDYSIPEGQEAQALPTYLLRDWLPTIWITGAIGG